MNNRIHFKQVKINPHDHTTLEILGRYFSEDTHLNFREALKIFVPRHLFTLMPEEYHEMFKVHLRLRSKIQPNANFDKYLEQPELFTQVPFSNESEALHFGRAYNNYMSRTENQALTSWQRISKSWTTEGSASAEYFMLQLNRHAQKRQLILDLVSDVRGDDLQFKSSLNMLLDFITHLEIRMLGRFVDILKPSAFEGFNHSLGQTLEATTQKSAEWTDSLASSSERDRKYKNFDRLFYGWIETETRKIYQFRRDQGLSIPQDEETSFMAQFEFEYNALKNFFYQPLYFDFTTEQTRTTKFIMHFGSYLVAFIAGGWGFAINAYLSNPGSGTALGGVGFGAITFVSALAYAFKDKIKEIGKNYLQDTLFDKFDLDKNEYLTARLPIFKSIQGSVRENYKIQKEDLPSDFSQDQFLGKLDFNCLVYQRQVRVQRSPKDPLLHLKQIWRVHFEPILQHLDDSPKKGLFINRQDRLSLQTFAREYYFPIAYQIFDDNKKLLNESLYLLVANSQGILRVENMEVLQKKRALGPRPIPAGGLWLSEQSSEKEDDLILSPT